MYRIELDKKWISELFNDDAQWWENAINEFLIDPKSELSREYEIEYLIYREFEGIVTAYDATTNEEISGWENPGAHWTQIEELGTKAFIEFFKSGEWKNT